MAEFLGLTPEEALRVEENYTEFLKDRVLSLEAHIRDTGEQIVRVESAMRLHPEARGLKMNLESLQKRFRNLEDDFAEQANREYVGVMRAKETP